MTEPRRVVVAGVAAISSYGASWRGLGAALRDPSIRFPDGPTESPLTNPKARNARKMMSRGAYLAAATLADLMRDVAWTTAQRELAGYFLGVGASGGSLDDVTALLDASIEGGFSLPAFGAAGLAACNPLLAFQLMNNFTLAHGAIFEGLGGPNGAVFSRGSGTTAALAEAIHAIASGDCDHAVAGGADSATHPVTRAELAREGFLERGLHPAEGAALLALSFETPSDVQTPRDPVVVIDGCSIASGRNRSIAAALDLVADRAIPTPAEHAAVLHSVDAAPPSGSGPIRRQSDLIVIAAWGNPASEATAAWARERFPEAAVVDTSPLGATLAAGPALGWAAAIDLLTNGHFERALVIDLGVDGDVGAVAFSTPVAVQAVSLRGAA